MINDDTQRNHMFTLDLQTFSDSEGDPEPEPKPLTMTQAEFDAKIADRITRERKKFSDYDELKSKLSEFENAEAERQRAAMTEQERVQAELAAAKKAAEEAEGKSAATLKAANDRVIKADFKLAAASANIRQDALDDAFLLADKAGITVDDDGNVKGIKEALDALVAAKPYLIEVTTPNKPRSIGDPNNPAEEQRKTLEVQLEDAEKRKDFGKVVELSNKILNLK
ncbi:scaffolding protein [Paenibacillus sp. GCM10012307]|uniref:Scaffolding protein n=1 Tax=Paenibacillus roseus TaxID=2798579 RepID=A0A934J3M6_9BACL|nr:scaffolding protein [Paenibacillus roseus]MBJ6364156.1 scaffolding protein [Paenibacillus roseus]